MYPIVKRSYSVEFLSIYKNDAAIAPFDGNWKLSWDISYLSTFLHIVRSVAHWYILYYDFELEVETFLGKFWEKRILFINFTQLFHSQNNTSSKCLGTMYYDLRSHCRENLHIFFSPGYRFEISPLVSLNRHFT